MILSTIVSGGQTGVDRAALDAAIELGIEHAGYCPKGRKAEDGAIPRLYQLEETESTGYPERTKLNVEHSDATVLLHEGRFGPGAKLTENTAKKLSRDFFKIDMRHREEAIADLISVFEIFPVVNFAGSRESSSPGIQARTEELIIDAYNEGIEEEKAGWQPLV